MTRFNPLTRLSCVLLILVSFLIPTGAQSGQTSRTWLSPSFAKTKTAAAQVKPFPREPSRDALKWADKELHRMSLDERIGQLIYVGINATFLNQDSEVFRALKHQVEDNHVGGLILFRGPVYESVVLVNRMQQLARYPLLISADLEEIGRASCRERV